VGELTRSGNEKLIVEKKVLRFKNFGVPRYRRGSVVRSRFVRIALVETFDKFR
jgi:hypothetical protein